MGGLAAFCGLVCSADRFVGRARLGITLPDVNAGTTRTSCVTCLKCLTPLWLHSLLLTEGKNRAWLVWVLLGQNELHACRVHVTRLSFHGRQVAGFMASQV